MTVTAHWYLSVYDRKTERLTFQESLSGVTDEAVRETFNATPDAIGGFEVLVHHLPFIGLHTSAEFDLDASVAFVEFLQD